MSEDNLTIIVLRDLQEKVSQMNRILVDVQIEVGATKSEMKASFSTLRGDLNRVETKVDLANERLEVVEHTVNDAASQIVFLGRRETNIEKRHDKAIADLRERVKALEDQAKEES
jgi:hypothetical protein